MNILMYRWKVFNQEDIKEAFEYFGHNVTELESLTFPEKGEVEDLIPLFGGYDAVFTVNFFIEVSNACEALHIKYICWTVDSPMLTMYDNAVFNECNYIFVFDRICYCNFKALGVKKLWYLPLAANTERLSAQLADMTEPDIRKYSAQVSFVGGLYDKNSYDKIYDILPDYLAGYFDSALTTQGDLYGYNVFDHIFTADIIEQLDELIDFKQAESGFSSTELTFNNTFLGYKHAQITRIKLINMLASHFAKSDVQQKITGNFKESLSMRAGIDVYTDNDDPRLIGVNYRGTVDYRTDMPKVFRCSGVNINLTMCNIRSGIPLRVWDILGAGGFVLTNYQSEIPEMFTNGKDIVYFDSFDDCVRKAEYYLTHEDERLSIARSGYEKVAKYHTYRSRIKTMLDEITRSGS